MRNPLANGPPDWHRGRMLELWIACGRGRFPRLLFLLLAAAALAAAPRAHGQDSPGSRFGFTGPEIFPIDNMIARMQAADMDGDGLLDLVVVNSLRSKINLLMNQTGRSNAVSQPKPRPESVNELPPDARFRIESVASEKRIASLVVADLNGDGRPDLAYYGEPKELVVHYRLGKEGWDTPKRFPIADGLLNPNSMVSGDLDGDGALDLVLLGESCGYYLRQRSDGTLAEPERWPYSGQVKSVQVLDINKDRRDDLLLVNWDSPTPLRFRLQSRSGQLGPEVYFRLPPMRSYTAEDLDGDRKPEIITVAQSSGRVQLSAFAERPAAPLLGELREGLFEVLPQNKSTQDRRGMVWADMDGDGRLDLLVAEPDSGLVTLYRQEPGGQMGVARSFPTLTGVNTLAAMDWDRDGRTELFLLSTSERQVGMTRLGKSGGLPFPEILPLAGRPLAIAVGCLSSSAPPVLAAVLEIDGGKRILEWGPAKGPRRRQNLSDQFKSNPLALAFHDLDQDGAADLALLIEYEKIKILRQKTAEAFEELDLAPPGGNIEKPWLSQADVDGDGRPEALLAQRNFVRAVVLEPRGSPAGDAQPTNWTFRVKEQINGAASNSRIVGAAALRNGSNRVATVFLLDAERQALTACERDAAGAWQAVRNLPLPVSDFHRLEPVALGAARANCIALMGPAAVAWMRFAGATWAFEELGGYETPIKDGYLNDVVAGDLDQDGRKDLVFLETAKNHLDLVTFTPPDQLKPANRWRVFEERTFRGRRAEGLEPREALVADLTGDGLNDLAVLVHDRILVYPQEPPEPD